MGSKNNKKRSKFKLKINSKRKMANEPKNDTFVIIVNVNSPNPTTYKSMLELIPVKGLSNVTFVAKGSEGKFIYGITSLFIQKKNLSNVKFVIKDFARLEP